MASASDTLKTQITAEYNLVKAWIALNPYWATLCGVAAGWVLSRIL